MKDREPEPRFTGGPARGGDFGAGRGGFGGGFAGGSRQLYISNVCYPVHAPVSSKSSPCIIC